jgi:hypothetical protein
VGKVEDEAEDIRAVREVTERYVDATYRGDVETLRGCFHQSAVMSGYLGEELLTGSPERFFKDIGSTPSMESIGAPYVAETTSLEVLGSAATVRVDETGFFGRFAFSNWFHLIKGEDGAWLIVSKLFAGSPDPSGD